MGWARGWGCATTLLGLWSGINRAHVGFAMSSGFSCPTEAVMCAADEVCSVCIDTLGSLSASSLGLGLTSSADCEELFADLCTVIKDTVCDATNDNFIALAACIVEDTNGCTGFTTCEEAPIASPAPSTSIGVGTSAAEATPAPTANPAAAELAESSGAATTAPSALDAAANATSGGFGVTASLATTLGFVSGVALLLTV